MENVKITHAHKTLESITRLYADRSLYCDVRVTVGERTFNCHKLILFLNSPDYFGSKLQLQVTAIHAGVQTVTITELEADEFEIALRYFYTGAIELSSKTVDGVTRAVKLFKLNDLKRACMQFMEDTLNVQSCVRYWNNAVGLRLKSSKTLQQRCLNLLARQFDQVSKTPRLHDVIPPEMMKLVIERDDLMIGNEQELCQNLLKWLHRRPTPLSDEETVDLLSRIRWSGVDLSYIQSDVMKVASMNKSTQCSGFLTKVITYKTFGVQFPGLKTHHRPPTSVETSIVICGSDDGNQITSDSYRIGLQSKQILTMDNIPIDMNREVTGCTNGDSMYVSGLGGTYTETWACGSNGGWTKCADMVEGRHKHCATFVNKTSMYALGGRVMSTNTTLSSVELFDTADDRWTTVGELAQCVHSAGCAAYKTSIYVFGGIGQEKSAILECIQKYDTMTQQCTKLNRRLPFSRSAVLRAVPWDESVILMNKDTCMIFDFHENKIQQRSTSLAAGVQRFGLVIDNETLFVLGGGHNERRGRGVEWTTTDVVKSIPVMDIIDNKPRGKWTLLTRLKSPSYVYACALMKSSAEITPLAPPRNGNRTIKKTER